MNSRQREQRQIRYSSAAEQAAKMSEKSSGFDELKIPGNFPIFKFKKKGTYRLSMLPYVVGEGNRYADPGFIHYERSYYTHKIGIEQKRHVCLKETFRKPCPVCEHIAKLPQRFVKDSPDYKLYRALKPGHRQIFALIDMDEQDVGVQLYPTYFYFGLGEAIANKVKANPEKYSSFYWLSGGYILGVSVSQEAFGGGTTYKVKNLEMEERREDLDDSILDKIPCLDDMPIELPYQKLKQIFLEGSPKAAETDSSKTESPSSVPLSTDSGRSGFSRPEPILPFPAAPNQNTSDALYGKQVSWKGGVWMVIKVSEDGTTVALEDEDNIIKKGVPAREIKLLEKATPERTGVGSRSYNVPDDRNYPDDQNADIPF